MGSPYAYPGEELAAMEGAVRYHSWIAERFAPHLGEQVVEVGAGIGSFTRHLLEAAQGSTLVAVEPSPMLAARLHERFRTEPRVRTAQGFLRDAGIRGTASSVVAVNVMEHVADDGAFLSEAGEALAPGGRLCLFVPAHQALWGRLDEAFGHLRRYDRSGLAALLEERGFRVLRLGYTNLPGVAAWWMMGTLLGRRTLSPGATLFYDRTVVPIIRFMERFGAPPFGQSLLVVSERIGGRGAR